MVVSVFFLHIPKDERQNLDSKSSSGVFVGHASESKAYRVYDPVKKRTVMARDVEFNESDLFNLIGIMRVYRLVGKLMSLSWWGNLCLLVSYLPLSSCLEEADDIEEQIIRKSAREKKQPNQLGEWA